MSFSLGGEYVAKIRKGILVFSTGVKASITSYRNIQLLGF
jgi:hypothetical protein